MGGLMEAPVTLVAKGLWAFAHLLAGTLLTRIPALKKLLSAVNMYFYAQALGLLWTFAVSLFAACATQAAEAVVGRDQRLRWGLVSLPALGYVYFCVGHLVVVCSFTMWMVMWESYHDYLTLRLILMGPRGRDEREMRATGSTSSSLFKAGPEAVEERIFRRQTSPREAYNKVHVLRRQVLLATPLVLLVCMNAVMLVGQFVCAGRADGVCRTHIFNPESRFNRNARFVLFVAIVQWVQIWTGLFPTWHRALLRSTSWLALALQVVLLAMLVPVSALRLVVWLLRPALPVDFGSSWGAGTPLGLVFQLKYQILDAAVVTSWGVWLLAVSAVILRRENLRHSGFSIKQIAEEPIWNLLSSSFKFTQSFLLLTAWVRSCAKAGFAYAQSDIIFLTVLYPWMMLFIWSTVMALISCLRLYPRIPVTMLSLAVSLVVCMGAGWLVCAFVGRSDSPLLVMAVGAHIAMQAFSRIRALLRERRKRVRTPQGSPRRRTTTSAPTIHEASPLSNTSSPDAATGGTGSPEAEFARYVSTDTAERQTSPDTGSGLEDEEDSGHEAGEGTPHVQAQDTGSSADLLREAAPVHAKSLPLPLPERLDSLPVGRQMSSKSTGGGSTRRLKLGRKSLTQDLRAIANDRAELLKSSVTERRWAGAAAQTLVVICVTFVAALSAMLLLGGVQQRAGLVVGDVVTWRGIPGGVEIINSAVSRLRLMARGGEEALEESVLQEGVDTPSYALCGLSWHGLSLLDYTMLAEVSYMHPSHKNDLPGLMRHLMPNREVTVRETNASVRRWLEFGIRQRSCINTTDCPSVTVIAISGTDPTRIEDYAENIRMWTEPVALQILSVFFPMVRTWPREATAELIGLNRAILREMSLQDDRWHYQEVLDFVARKPANETVVMTGHSLGGGMALVVGALTGRFAVALQPPGVYHSLAKHQSDSRVSGSGAVHQRSVTLKFEGDWIQHFDDHGGLVQTMSCDRVGQGVQLACHMIEGAVCHLLRHCGDEQRRFRSCSHEYAPSSAVHEVLSFVVVWLRQIWETSRWRQAHMFKDMGPKVITALCISVVPLLYRRATHAPSPVKTPPAGAGLQGVPECSE